MHKCAICNNYCNICGNFDNCVICKTCDHIIYPCPYYMAIKYNVPIIYQYQIDCKKFVDYEPMIPKNKKIEFEIEKRKRDMLLFVKNTYYTAINKFSENTHHMYFSENFKYSDTFIYSRIRNMHVNENNKLIEDYACSLESKESIKQKLKDCYKKYCTMSDRLTHLINLIYSIIDEDMSSYEKIAKILNIGVISQYDIDVFTRRVNCGILIAIYGSGRILISCKMGTYKNNLNDFTKNLMVINEIVNSADINLQNANEIKKAGIMDKIYDNLKDCYHKVMAIKVGH